MSDFAVSGPKGHHAAGPTIPMAIRGQAERVDDGFTFSRADGSERHYTFAEIHDEMNRRGAGLLALGLKKGDRAGFILPEPEDFVLTFLGALAVGVIPVPMYPPLSFGKLDAYIDTAATILSAAEADVVVTDGKVQSIIWSLVDRVPTLRGIHTVSDFSAADSAPVDIDHIELDDIAFLQFTSGSTALPKGVVVSHRCLLANLFGIMHFGLKIDDNDRAVSWLPLYHDMGLIGFMLAPAWYGVPTYYISTLQFIKRPTVWMQTMHDFKGTITFGPNFAYSLATRRTKEAQLAKLDLSHVKVLGCGAEPNHPATLSGFVEHFAAAGLRPEAILPSYGMAEATLAIGMCDLRETLRSDLVDNDAYHGEGIGKAAIPDSAGVLEYVSCGRPFPGHEVLIMNDAGEALADRHVGEVVVRGPSVADGYYKNPEATAATFTEHGLRTGDVGYMVDGELFVTGRKKDIVILNGRNYDPQTIEWAAAEVEGVRKGNVVAFSCPSETTEKLVVVAETKVEGDDERKALSEKVRAHIGENLLLPVADTVLVAPGQLPKTSSGKVQRSKTRQQYLDGALGREGVRTLGARGDTMVLARHFARSLVSRMRYKVRRRAARFFNTKAARSNDRPETN